MLRAKAEEINKILAGIDGVEDQHVDISTDVPQLQVEVEPGEGGEVRPETRRRPPRRRDPGRRRGGRRHLPRREGVRRRGVEHRADPQQRAGHRESAPSTRRRARASGSRMWRGCRSSRIPTPSSARATRAASTSAPRSVEGRDLGSVAQELNEKLAGVEFARGYHAEVLGEYQERQAAQASLLATAVIAGAAILLLLQAAFGSWRPALLVFLTLPMALVGGVMAAFLGGGIISLGSLIGFFTVFGIAARNGILLINHCQHLEREEGETFGPALVLRGARERLAPDPDDVPGHRSGPGARSSSSATARATRSSTRWPWSSWVGCSPRPCSTCS